MPFICFVESRNRSVPHMQPLDAETLEAALEEAAAVMASHGDGVVARVFEDSIVVGSVKASEAA